MLIAAASAGCAPIPAFRMSLPDRIETTGKTIAVIGDLQQTSGFVRFVRRREFTAPDQRRLVADLYDHIEELAALVVVGDLVYSGRSARDWEHFDWLMAPFANRITVLPTAGNHDYPCFLVQFCRTSKMAYGMRARFPWLEPGQPYSVAAEDLLLLFIDSESRLETQTQWLRAQLDAARGIYSAALVFFHRPAYTNSIERTATGSAEVKRFVLPALQEARLPTVVFNGHIHGFEHIEHEGLHFITTAGGGGPRVAMPDANSRSDAIDAYDGPECRSEGRSLRPFNYVLVHRDAGQLRIEVRGFCRDDTDVRVLHSFEIAL